MLMCERDIFCAAMWGGPLLAALILLLAGCAGPTYDTPQAVVAAISAERVAAIRECSERAAKFRQYTWGTHQLHVYRSCMASRGQVE